MKIMRGDAYPVPLDLKQDGYVLTPDKVDDIEITVGNVITRKISSGGVFYNSDTQLWYIRLTQEETLAMAADESYQVIARVKYRNEPADVMGIKCGSIVVEDSNSSEVI